MIERYFEIEREKRSQPKEEWQKSWKEQFAILTEIMKSPILRPAFFIALDESLQEARRHNGK